MTTKARWNKGDRQTKRGARSSVAVESPGDRLGPASSWSMRAGGPRTGRRFIAALEASNHAIVEANRKGK